MLNLDYFVCLFDIISSRSRMPLLKMSSKEERMKVVVLSYSMPSLEMQKGGRREKKQRAHWGRGDEV